MLSKQGQKGWRMRCLFRVNSSLGADARSHLVITFSTARGSVRRSGAPPSLNVGLSFLLT